MPGVAPGRLARRAVAWLPALLVVPLVTWGAVAVSQPDDPAEVLSTTPTPWWSDAWSSVELAGHPPKPAKPLATQIDGSNEK